MKRTFLLLSDRLLRIATVVVLFIVAFTIPAVAQKKKPRATADALCFSSPVSGNVKIMVWQTPSTMLKCAPVKSTRFVSDQSLPVKSVSDAKVVNVFDIDGSNNVLLAKTGTHFIYYSNITNFTVKKGDTLSAEQLIGYIDWGVDSFEMEFGVFYGLIELDSSQFLALNPKK